MVCLIDPVGDVYACPFAIHENFLAGNVRGAGRVRRASGATRSCSPGCGEPQTGGRLPVLFGAYDSCRGGCMAAKFFTGLPLDGPDPECVKGHGEHALCPLWTRRGAPRPSGDHSHPAGVRGGPVPVTIGRRRPPQHACDESPLAGIGADA